MNALGTAPAATPPHAPDAPALRALARKYHALASLRRARARGEPVPPREAFRVLSREFPGALRELDTVPLDALDARAEALERASAGHAPCEPWMSWLHGYHAWMRAALWLKPRLARGRRAVGDWGEGGEGHAPDALDALARGAAEHHGRAVDAAFVRAVDAPPAGRLRGVVLARVAGEHGVPVEHVHAALFTPPPGRAR